MIRLDNNILRTEYSEEMQKSYINYAMSVIVARALPDVRDGLKPVQRRTLYDMYELGIRYDRPYRKSARIVGDTMGKYHPHGDSSIYDALVVMSQGFKKGMPLIDGHGNFGSIEGDGAAAMRYTEARLEKVTQEAFLSELDKDVVDFMPNFDETEQEPEVLPAKIPNLLVNGADGIAVGMVTNIPPHNLGEVIEGVKAYLKNENITDEELMEYIKGPDFPTGGIVINKDELPQIYKTGSGKIRIRGKVEVEEGKNGKSKLVITQIPYTMIGANIGKFLNDICALIESKQITDITDITNESKEEIRIVLELKKNADIENIKNILYKKTKLEDTFGVNMLAVADKKPETLSLRQIIKYHVDFQFETNTRKYKYLLEKEEEKKEVQEGLIKACDVIDLIIEIIRGSKTIKEVRDCLINGNTGNIKFKSEKSKKEAAQLRFTERQTKAILDMQLHRLIGLEIEALLKQHEETLEKISDYTKLLSDRKEMGKHIIKELNSFAKEFAHPRRTVIENKEAAVIKVQEVKEQDVVVLMDRFGYIKSVDDNVYERNKEAADSENRHIIHCKNISKICVFTDIGRMHQIKVSDIPYGRFKEKGTPIDNICNYDSSVENIIFMESLDIVKEKLMMFATAQGMMKLVNGAEFEVSKKTIAASKLNDTDRLVCVQCIDTIMQELVIQTKNGFCLKFELADVPMKKKAAVGVRAIKLSDKDEVDIVYLLGQMTEAVGMYNDKEISLNRLKLAKRDGKGTKIKS